MTSLNQLSEQVRTVSRQKLPELIGKLRELEAEAMIRLHHVEVPKHGGTEDAKLGSYLTAEQVADALQVSERWVRNHRKELGGVGTRKLLRFAEKDIVAWLDNHKKG